MTRNRIALAAFGVVGGMAALLAAGAGMGISAAQAPVAPAKAAKVSSEPYVWRNVEIVGGGFVTGITFHPKEKGLIYARTDIGGAYRWNPATKRWVPLQDWLSKSDWNLYGVESIGIDPTDPKRLYLAAGTYTNSWAGNGAILRSTDQGRTWQRTDMPFKLGGNENGRSIGERLAVNPVKPSTVYFGSRHDGLWRSEDYGATWKKVETFPITGQTNGIGIGFILFQDKAVYVAVCAPGVNLYRSTDDGKTWEAVPGQPSGLLPHHGLFDKDGTLYLTYSNGPGPNGVTDGAVWKWDAKTGLWTDITPVKPGSAGAGAFGYAGLSLDAQRPGTLVVSSLDKWSSGDEIWRTTDGGTTWHSLKPKSVRDSSGAPFLNWDRPQADLGHWIGDLEIDPFQPGHVLYVTGATIWGSDDVTNADSDQPTHWTVRAQGLEETAVLDLLSPPSGAPLLSALGDIGGFRHDDLDTVPPTGMYKNPLINSTESMDFAENVPNLIVRVGRGKPGQHGGISLDGGKTWNPFSGEPAGTRGGGRIAMAADGSAIVWTPNNSVPYYSKDRGATWTAAKGLPTGVSPVADRFIAKNFYATDTAAGMVYRSEDGGETFTATGAMLPKGGDNKLRTPFRAPRNVWYCAGGNGLWRSTDGGATFTPLEGVLEARSLGFGMPPPGIRYPTLYLNGTVEGIAGVFRSTDVGNTWVRIDDDQHRFGTMNVITGDPSVYGRVYLGTNGRGILYAEPQRQAAKR